MLMFSLIRNPSQCSIGISWQFGPGSMLIIPTSNTTEVKFLCSNFRDTLMIVLLRDKWWILPVDCLSNCIVTFSIVSSLVHVNLQVLSLECSQEPGPNRREIPTVVFWDSGLGWIPDQREHQHQHLTDTAMCGHATYVVISHIVDWLCLQRSPVVMRLNQRLNCRHSNMLIA